MKIGYEFRELEAIESLLNEDLKRLSELDHDEHHIESTFEHYLWAVNRIEAKARGAIQEYARNWSIEKLTFYCAAIDAAEERLDRNLHDLSKAKGTAYRFENRAWPYFKLSSESLRAKMRRVGVSALFISNRIDEIDAFLVLLANTYYKSHWLGDRSKEGLTIRDFKVTSSSDAHYVFGHLDLIRILFERGLDEVGELSDQIWRKEHGSDDYRWNAYLDKLYSRREEIFSNSIKTLASYLPGFTNFVKFSFFDDCVQSLYKLSRVKLSEVVVEGKTHEEILVIQRYLPWLLHGYWKYFTHHEDWNDAWASGGVADKGFRFHSGLSYRDVKAADFISLETLEDQNGDLFKVAATHVEFLGLDDYCNLIRNGSQPWHEASSTVLEDFEFDEVIKKFLLGLGYYLNFSERGKTDLQFKEAVSFVKKQSSEIQNSGIWPEEYFETIFCILKFTDQQTLIEELATHLQSEGIHDLEFLDQN